VPTPETQPFWDGCASRRTAHPAVHRLRAALLLPAAGVPGVRLAQRRVVHRQRPRATLYSYVINHRPAPGFEDDAPYAIAVVELDEGPRMMTSITGLPATPEALQLDMPLRVRSSRGAT